MRKASLVLILPILFCFSCRRHSPQLEPEASPPFEATELPGLSLSALPTYFFNRGDRVGVVQSDGRLFLFAPDPLRIEAAETLPFPLDPQPSAGRGLVWLRDSAINDTRLLYDLEKSTVVGRWLPKTGEQMLGADRRFRLVFRDGAMRIERWSDGGEIKVFKTASSSFFNIRFDFDVIYGNDEKTLFCFYPQSNVFAKYALPLPAASAGFIKGNRFYYGTTTRYLVCSILRFHYGKAMRHRVESTFRDPCRVKWKVRLPDTLAYPPMIFHSRIVAVTRGDAVIFLNARGSVTWWMALPSYVRGDPVMMKDHLAFLLHSNEMIWLDERTRKALRFPLSGRTNLPLFLLDRFLFTLLGRPEEGRTVVRIGSLVGVGITWNPKQPWAGRSMAFEFSIHNMTRPRLTVRIEDASGHLFLEKEILPFQTLGLAWIPANGGRFCIRVRAECDGKIRESKAEFDVVDWSPWLPGFLKLICR